MARSERVAAATPDKTIVLRVGVHKTGRALVETSKDLS